MSRVYKAASLIHSDEPYVLSTSPDQFVSYDESFENDENSNENENRAERSARAEEAQLLRQSSGQAEEILNQANFRAQKMIDDANDQLSTAMHAREAAEEASRNAAEQIMRARTEAAELLANAQIEAEALKSTAAEQGYSEGFNRGRFEVANANSELFAEMQAAIERLDREKGKLFEIYEDELIKIAATIARKVVQMELNTAEDSFIYILTQAAKQFRNSKNVTLTIKDGQLSADLIGDPDFLKVVFAGIEHVDIVEKSDVECGSCIMDNGSLILDAGANTQIDLIEEELLS